MRPITPIVNYDAVNKDVIRRIFAVKKNQLAPALAGVMGIDCIGFSQINAANFG
nr:hypothetical protein [uncultured Flavobacterium sp.]